MTQLTDEKVVCPKCQTNCPKDKCDTCDWVPFKPQKIVFHTTPEAALIEILQKAFWPKG